MPDIAVSYDPQETSTAIARIADFLDRYGGRRRVFLLVGPFGSGKSWCLRQAGGSDVVNLSAHLALAVKNQCGERFHEIASQPRNEAMGFIGEMMRQNFWDLLTSKDPIFVDSLELLYSYPYFDFVREAESASEKGSRVILAIPGYISQGRIYFIDRNLFNLQIGPTRIDRCFELKGVRE